MSVTEKAIDIAGGPVKLARELKITRQAVEQWRLIPPRHVLAVERITGISRYELRPDVYGQSEMGARVRYG